MENIDSDMYKDGKLGYNFWPIAYIKPYRNVFPQDNSETPNASTFPRIFLNICIFVIIT